MWSKRSIRSSTRITATNLDDETPPAFLLALMRPRMILVSTSFILHLHTVPLLAPRGHSMEKQIQMRPLLQPHLLPERPFLGDPSMSLTCTAPRQKKLLILIRRSLMMYVAVILLYEIEYLRSEYPSGCFWITKQLLFCVAICC